MMKILTISRNTIKQIMRQSLYGVLILVTFAFLILSVPLTGWTLDPNAENSGLMMLENLNLSTLMVLGFLCAVFGSTTAITQELHDKTALTVLSKPVSRAAFVFGKFLGSVGAMTVAFYICMLLFLMTVRHGALPTRTDPWDFPVIVLSLSAIFLALITAGIGNYSFGWSFVSAFTWSGVLFLSIAMVIIGFVGKMWIIIPFGEGIRPELFTGIFMLYLAAVIVCAVASAVSTRFGQIPAIMICFTVIVIGSMHNYVFARYSNNSLVLPKIGWIFPNLTYFYPADALMTNQPIAGKFIALITLYAALYTSGVLAAGAWLFQRGKIDPEDTSPSIPSGVRLIAWAGRLSAAVMVLLGVEVLTGMIGYFFDSNFSPSAAMFIDRIISSSSDTVSGYAALPAAGMIIVGIGAWIFFGMFARGAGWTFWTMGTVLLGLLILSVVLLILNPGERTWRIGAGRIAICAFCLLCMIVPKSRHHFKS